MNTVAKLKAQIRRRGDAVLTAPEQVAGVAGGKLYRRGSVIVAVWTHDILGRVMADGRETWTLPDNAHGTAEAARNFEAMLERWGV